MGFRRFAVIVQRGLRGGDGSLLKPRFVDVAEVPHVPRQQFDLQPAEAEREKVVHEIGRDVIPLGQRGHGGGGDLGPFVQATDDCCASGSRVVHPAVR